MDIQLLTIVRNSEVSDTLLNAGIWSLKKLCIIKTLTETLLISIPGAFLIPYFIMMVIEGLPLFMIELAVGQRFRTSAPGSWATVHPALKGVGVACLVVSGLLCVYYICVMAWCLQYLFASFQKTLPWSINNCPR